MLERRLPKAHTKYIYYQDMLNRTKAGYAGERRVDQEWREIYLQQAYYLLHDVEFKAKGGLTYQINTLLMTQYFILVLEIKNISGRVDFMAENHQFIRVTSDGRVDGFRNPLDQVKRHARFMSRMLHMRGHHIPVEFFCYFCKSKFDYVASFCDSANSPCKWLG